MGKWDEGLSGSGDYLSTAIGKEVIVTIKQINRITAKPDFEPKNKAGVGQGFLFEFVGDEGIVTVSTFSLQAALKDADVDVGDTIQITHPSQGVYLVEKL